MCGLPQTNVHTLVKPAGGKHHAEAKEKNEQTREERNCFRDEKIRAVTCTTCPRGKVLIKQQKTGIKPPFYPKP